MTKGPKAYPSTYTETTKPARRVLDEWNSVMTSGIPGANMEDAKGLRIIRLSHAKTNYLTHVRKVMDEMTAILPHFRPPAQLFGLLGSSGPSHPTMLGSTSVCSVSSSFLLDREPRWAASRSTSSSRLEPADEFFSLSSDVEEAAGDVGDLVAPGSTGVSFSGFVDDSNCSGA